MNSPLIESLSASFSARFGRAPTLLVQAPGRVNLIGEHTDYNDGFVLPCAIDFHTLVAGQARADRRVRVLAAEPSGGGRLGLWPDFSPRQTRAVSR